MSDSQKLRLIPDVYGDKAGVPYKAAWNDARVLAAGVAESYTVPTGYRYLLVTPVNGDVWVRVGAAAAIPAGDVSDGSASIPIVYGQSVLLDVESGQTVSLISVGACLVGIGCYKN